MKELLYGDPDFFFCNLIIPNGEAVRRRCTRDTNHRGPHWSQTEPVPLGCRCKLFCHCDDPRFQ